MPGKPSSARVLRRGSDHFLIEWEEPEEPNGILTGYDVGFSQGKSRETTSNISNKVIRVVLGVFFIDLYFLMKNK